MKPEGPSSWRVFSSTAAFDASAFFDLPQGCTYANLAQIHSGMAYSQAGGMTPFSFVAAQDISTYREKPWFTCYLPEL
jgi:hypothetical protein